MTQRVPNGLVLSIASAFGASKALNSITNANPAVGTLEASHLVAVADIFEVVTSGWDALEGRVVRASAVATNDVTFEGIDTTSTTAYPAGSGAGTVREISTWTQIGQVRGISRSGGEQQYADATLLSDVIMGRQIPTTRSPIAMAVTVAEDPAMAWLSTVRTVAANRTRTPFRIAYPGGGFLYGSAFWSLLEVPTMEAGAVMEVSLDLALAALPTRYAS